MSQRKTEHWNRKLADLKTAYTGHPLLAELETLLGSYGKLERRLEKVASISDKMQSHTIDLNEALRISETRFRMLTENMVDVVWTLNPKTRRFTYISPSIEKLRGYTPDEVMAEPLEAGLHESQREEACALIARRVADLQTGSLLPDNAFTSEVEQTQKDGGSVWTEVLTRYLINPQSGEIEIHGVMRDISQRKQIQNQLFATMKGLERAEAEQRQLLSIASHEFRTPAAMIKASLDSLAFLKEQIPSEVARRLENIGQASLRLNKLANNLISQDRLQELALKPQKQAIDLCQLVREVIEKYPTNAQESSLSIQLPKHPVIINADATLLGIALHNLIDNAQRHHAAPDLPIRVSLEENCNRADYGVELRVADHGPGIADSEKTKIFQRFYSTKGNQSHGIGLSIVQSVASTHGGSVHAIDNTPCGSILLMRLPAEESPAVAAHTPHRH